MRTVTTLGLLAVLLLGLPRPGDAWTFRYDDPEHDVDSVRSLRVGPGGELYAAGPTGDESGLFRLDPATGATVWRYDFGAAPDTLMYDTLDDVATDAAGNVFAAGSINFDFDAVRVDPVTGQEVWHTTLNGTTGTFYDFARAVAVDGFGGVVVVGGIQEHATPFGPDFTAVRMDAATGDVLWKTVIDGGASTPEIFRGEWAEDVAIAPNGDAIAVGSLTVDEGGGSDDRIMAAVRFARDDGHEMWRWTYRSSAPSLVYDMARHVVMDAAGDVILAGEAAEQSAAVFKLDGATGAERWRFLDPTEYSNGVAVDAAGDVLVAAGATRPAFPWPSTLVEFAVLKLDGTTGAVRWRTQLPGGPSQAGAVAVDGAQDVIAVGSRRGVASAVKLTGPDGHVLWSRRSNPGPGVRDGWGSVVLDASDHVFAGGNIAGPPDGSPADLDVTALDETTGAGVGCGNGVLDLGETCDDGNAADFDGCDALCTVEHCGDGVVDPGEQCDDGGHVAGDGCDPQCNFEGCGNGELDPGESCDDGNRISGDICSSTCQIEICETPNVAPATRMKLRKLGGVPGDERMVLQMTISSSQLPIRFQLTVEDLGAGGAPFLDLSYRTNLLGGIVPDPGCDPRTDLRLGGAHGDTYLNRTDALPPLCAPGSASGFRKMTVKPVRAVPGQYALKATFQHASLPTPVGPLRATVVVGEDVWAKQPGICWRSSFTAGQCGAAGPTGFDCE